MMNSGQPPSNPNGQYVPHPNSGFQQVSPQSSGQDETEEKVYLEEHHGGQLYLHEPHDEQFGDEIIEHEEVETESEGEAIDFLQDRPRDMTLGRRIALTLKCMSCYYPKKKKEKKGQEQFRVSQTQRHEFHHFDPSKPGAAGSYPFTSSKKEYPSLSLAWAYFEHFALPRYIVDEETKGLDSAEPGENRLPTKLYNPYCTPHRQLGDYGLGVGLYFTTLRALCILTFLGGCLSIPNILFFASDDYDSKKQDGISEWLRGSAICTDTTYVICEDCSNHTFPDSRIGDGFNEATGQNATFYLRNNCNGATEEQTFINLGVLALIALGLLVMNITIRNAEEKFDEDEQTAQDYSITITNPPIDAYDPEEWRAFFMENFNAYVTVCTVGVDNDLLVASLVERREKLKKIENSVEPGTSLDIMNLGLIAAKQEEKRGPVARFFAKLAPGIPELVQRVVVLNSKIQGLAQESKPVTNVFVTFETEADQRKVLYRMINGKSVRFRGTHRLKAKESDEPNTIRWQDLNETRLDRFKQQAITTFATFVAIVVVAAVVAVGNDFGVGISAIAISVANVLFPQVAKLLTNVEAHHSESTKQRSLYFKIALFRWINTAVIITIITRFQDTLADEQGLIQQVYALFFTEIVTTNVLQLVDIGGHVNRHILAPRAKNQDAMNLAMQGSVVELAERFTNMTKIFFLALWYSSIFPAGLFFCSIALFINYYTDRFSLMRTWKRMPHLGPKISQLSRHYFFPIAAAAMAIFSSYYWSGFPFDNLCTQDDRFVDQSFAGEWLVTKRSDADGIDPLEGDDNEPVTATIDDTTPATINCRQDFLRYYTRDVWEFNIRIRFPFFPEYQEEGLEWMTQEQENQTEIWGWVSVGFAGLVAVVILLGILKACCIPKRYKPRGDDQGICFSDVETISSFVPQVNSPIFAYPLVACNVDLFDDELFDWKDPDRPYVYYDITKDAKHLLHGTNEHSEAVTFSQMRHWPPMKEGEQASMKEGEQVSM